MESRDRRDERENKVALFAHFLSIELSSQPTLSEQRHAAVVRETDETIYTLKQLAASSQQSVEQLGVGCPRLGAGTLH